LRSIINYFVKRHLLSNFILIAVFVGGIYFWHNTNKEQLPNISFDRLRISVSYPGASPADVEYFVTYPIENAVKNLEGVKEIESTVGTGITTILVDLDTSPSEKAEVVNNIKSVVLSLSLPDDIRDEPSFRVFETSQIAITDLLLYDKDSPILTNEKRKKLQEIAETLENQLLHLPHIREVTKSGYLEEEININLNPNEVAKNQLSFSRVLSEIKKNNVRIPIGELEDENTSKVSLRSELFDVTDLENLIIQGNFSGNFLRLKEIADISYTFKENTSILKANGYEAIELRVVKNTSHGIIEATDAVRNLLEKFRTSHLRNTDIELIMLKDESTSVKDRISLIVKNGILGFILIIILLFIFLDFKSGFWVALGIPFTICFTLIVGSLLGLTINNITLASIIVVLGMVVDDAIVVAENIARSRSSGLSDEDASVEGTRSVIQPVTASILTTCLTFIPLLFFQGRISRINQSMPLVISLMLGASLLESMFILPGHLNLHFPFFKVKKKSKKEEKNHWFLKIENKYGFLLTKILKHKLIVFIIFILLFLLSTYIFNNHLRFVMFPSEETTEVFISAIATDSNNMLQTAKKTEDIEKILKRYLDNEVIGIRTYIATGSRGRVGRENNFRIRVELVTQEKRKKSTSQLLAEWRKQINELKGFDRINVTAQRFGQASGSPIEVVILENNDALRFSLAQKVKDYLETIADLQDVEIDEPLRTPEYTLKIERDSLKKLNLGVDTIGTTLRTALSGTRIYSLLIDNKELDVNLTTHKKYKDNIKDLLTIPIETSNGYLVPLTNLVHLEREVVPGSIERKQQKRITKVFANIKNNSKLTPLDIAESVENNLFPELMSKNPSSYIYFGGEVQDSRESTNEFVFGVLFVLVIIYIILSLLFNSLLFPFVIMLIIPFGVIGVILAYYFHGIQFYGFFSLIGILGLIGVVINDSIVMLSKLLSEQNSAGHLLSNEEIAKITQTRLRAVLLTTLTTVAGLFPTAYGIAGFDSMLSEMMLAMGWGLIFGTLITLVLTPSLFSLINFIQNLILKIFRGD
jgi:multidrug efflux pump subunit AcrB